MFKKLRNKATALIHKAKENYFRNILHTGLTNKELWKKLKSMKICSNNIQKANNFSANDINEELVKNFSSSNNSFVPIQDPPPLESFYFQQITEIDVITELFHVRSNAVGMDRIPIEFIKSICPAIVKPITHLFNVILYTSEFPKAWKISKIKKASQNTLSNLRPISILSALSKVLERILKAQMGYFINQHNLIKGCIR